MNEIFSASERFLRYVTIDTQSDPNSRAAPSSEKQKDLSRVLYEELRALQLEQLELTEFGHVLATIPSNSGKMVPRICFCAHIDTAPDCSGTGVKPILHRNYQGEDIVLPDDTTQIISPRDHPHLLSMIGHDIITASGTTLLGSDDKAGVAEIVDLAHFLTAHPEIKHGEIRILFTPDEEVGRGTENLDMNKIAADYGYTVDGGPVGSIEDQTFSADGVNVIIHGVAAHPGYAKNKLVNALKIAAEIIAALPKKTQSPETTEKEEGYLHPVGLQGIPERCVLTINIRDFVTAELAVKEQMLEQLVSSEVQKFPGARYEFIVSEQYRNMKGILDRCPQILENASEAMKRVGVEPGFSSMRGGTDGSKLSFLGLPCANLFAGQRAIHSKLEHISVQDMGKAVEVLVALVQVWEERA